MSLALIDRNDVVLRGRLSAPVELRPLPSGDTLLLFKLVVRRESPRPRGPKSDVLTCVSTAKGLITRAQAWHPDDVIEVDGALQRRFWRTPNGTAVAYEVSVRGARKATRSHAWRETAVDGA
ncbi:single-stranded DNA-binding protein [Modestobacter sp. Leaf380]|uniref:single-stranded DNA-binding protein n=1 Tax=Modestobacter sp. Leaf380 TaxID=1736356 RepID=UPI0006F7543A|nr:single-stranded DNA-binding protein [Modestobacter sp. Leaf380]KQS64354.1 single-stranded DNA-binding protein [Modestobacter sp. Leaf380]